MSVSKPRPSDFPILVLFVVGGITCSEVRQIREALATHRTNTQVIRMTELIIWHLPSNPRALKGLKMAAFLKYHSSYIEKS